MLSVLVWRSAVQANRCTWDPVEIKDKWIGGVEGVADNKAYTVHTIEVIRSLTQAKDFSSYSLRPERFRDSPSLLHDGYRGAFPRG
jgi:hypothetical protein